MTGIESILKVVRGIVRIRGNTDNTLIGNEGDSLKVSSAPGTSASSRFLEFVVDLKNAGNIDMRVDGSTTAVDFTAGPTTANEIWYVTHISIEIEGSGTIDPNDFAGSTGSLTNGIDVIEDIGGTEYTLFNFKNNISISKQFGAEVVLGQASGWLNSNKIFTGRFNIQNRIGGLELRQVDGDQIIARVNDDLTVSGITRLQMSYQYYRVKT